MILNAVDLPSEDPSEKCDESMDCDRMMRLVQKNLGKNYHDHDAPGVGEPGNEEYRHDDHLEQQ